MISSASRVHYQCYSLSCRRQPPPSHHGGTWPEHTLESGRRLSTNTQVAKMTLLSKLSPRYSNVMKHTAQGHTCEQCGENFDTHRQLSTHMWSKHKIKSSFRQFIGNTSVCPVCHTDFCTRARLIKHLADRRVRSRHREQTCQQAFLASDPELVPPDELAELERVEAQDKKRQRRISSSAIIAAEPARPARQSALKRARVEPPARVPTMPKRPRRH